MSRWSPPWPRPGCRAGAWAWKIDRRQRLKGLGEAHRASHDMAGRGAVLRTRIRSGWLPPRSGRTSSGRDAVPLEERLEGRRRKKPSRAPAAQCRCLRANEHSRNKERHKSVSVESRLAGARLLGSAARPAIRSTRHGCRAPNWKGYLRLSLVSCPIALYPRRVRARGPLQRANRKTGNRIRYSKVDAETGEEVDSDDIIKGYQVSKGHCIEITDEDLEAVTVIHRGPSHRPVVPREDRRPLQHQALFHRPRGQGRSRCVRHNPGGDSGYRQGRDQGRGAVRSEKDGGPYKEKVGSLKKAASKTASTRKRTPAKTTASKSRAIAGGSKARGRTAANTAPRAKSKRSTTKSVLNRSGARRTRRTENATLGAAITNPVSEAMALGTEVVGGAIQAGGEIVAATADMANSAARTAVAVTTGVVPDASPKSAADANAEAGAEALSRTPVRV